MAQRFSSIIRGAAVRLVLSLPACLVVVGCAERDAMSAEEGALTGAGTSSGTATSPSGAPSDGVAPAGGSNTSVVVGSPSGPTSPISDAVSSPISPGGTDASAGGRPNEAGGAANDGVPGVNTGVGAAPQLEPAASAGEASGAESGTGGGAAVPAGSGGSGGAVEPVSTFPELEELKAFPTAEGYGRYAEGGRGGRVVEVTNLDDSGPGSLRDAIDQTGPRTIVFNVSGTITLESKLLISGTKANGRVTVAGQTAPGKGILIRGWTMGMIGGEDVIMRFLRTRIGTISGETMDGMGMASANNSIYDHLSIGWTIDEAFSSRSAKNITLQRTLISEALNEAGHENYDPGTQHGYAASIGGDIGSFHHNLLAHCAGRNWSLAGGLVDGTLTYAGRLDIRNNVVFNWRNRTTDGGAHEVNFVNNYYKPGPATELFVALTAENDGFEGTQRYYVSGNVMPGHFDESNQEAARREAGEPRDYDPWVDNPFFESHVVTQSAEEAYEDVLADVGCNRPMLDEQDQRIIQETRDGTATYSGSRTGYPGLIDNEADVGGWEDYPEAQRAPEWDTDHDGMPNTWEDTHGLDPEDPSDGNATTFSTVGYTNLEMYLNELAGDFD